MSNLTVIDFVKKEDPEYNELYQDIKTIIAEKYGCFTMIEIVGILECMSLEFKHKAMIIPDEQID